MTYLHLSQEEREQVCEDLLCIINAGLWQRLVAMRLRMVREHRPAPLWQQLDADRLAREAASIVGATPKYWKDAAAAVTGIRSVGDVNIEAVRTLADDVRRWQEPKPKAAPARLSVGNSRKRGAR